MVDKDILLQQLRDRVAADLDTLIRRQQDTQRAATHGENKAEHAKDTRATEQGYLARGLAVRVDEMRFTLEILGRLEWTEFHPQDPIAVTALVTLRDEDDARLQTWWLIPGAGGFELTLAEKRIQTLTPVAPLGRALLGLRVGDEASFSTPRGRRHFEILQIA